jgi:hypothetical protein
MADEPPPPPLLEEEPGGVSPEWARLYDQAVDAHRLERERIDRE